MHILSPIVTLVVKWTKKKCKSPGLVRMKLGGVIAEMLQEGSIR